MVIRDHIESRCLLNLIRIVGKESNLAYAYCFQKSLDQKIPKARALQNAMLSYMLACSQIDVYILC